MRYRLSLPHGIFYATRGNLMKITMLPIISKLDSCRELEHQPLFIPIIFAPSISMTAFAATTNDTEGMAGAASPIGCLFDRPKHGRLPGHGDWSVKDIADWSIQRLVLKIHPSEIAELRQLLVHDRSILQEHPQRPVEGCDCQRSEVSGRRLQGLFGETLRGPPRPQLLHPDIPRPQPHSGQALRR